MGLECEQFGHCREKETPALLTFWARESRYWRPLLQAWLLGVQPVRSRESGALPGWLRALAGGQDGRGLNQSGIFSLKDPLSLRPRQEVFDE